jgi:hypothetical protein
MKNAHCTTWNMAEKLKNFEKEKCTLWDLEYVRNLKNMKNDTHTVEYWVYGENTEKCGK